MAMLACATACAHPSEQRHTRADGASAAASAVTVSVSTATKSVTVGASTAASAVARPKDNAAPSTPNAAAPLNVVLITVDSLRADVPWLGYPRDIAPRLTELAQRSVVYTHAYSLSSFTSKSVGGLLAGDYPSALTRDGQFFTRYFPSNLMFPEILQAAGVHTAAGHAHMYLDKGHGFEQGFDAYRVVDGITFDYNKDPYITSQKLTPLAMKLIGDAAAQGTFFAWFHYMDPHDVYLPHPGGPTFGRRARDLYDGEVFYTDQWIGKLLDFIESSPWGKRTAIIVSADHGEAFGEHGFYRHAHELWEELVHVPLVFFVPGAAPRVIEQSRSAVDLAPTILELTGVKSEAALRGVSLVAEVMGREAPAERPVICDLPEDTFNDRRRALIEGDYKLIAFGNDARYELYQLRRDPGEKENLMRKDPEHAKQMLARYRDLSSHIAKGEVKGGYLRKAP